VLEVHQINELLSVFDEVERDRLAGWMPVGRRLLAFRDEGLTPLGKPGRKLAILRGSCYQDCTAAHGVCPCIRREFRR